MGELKSFTSHKSRPLPVFILADVSGSMATHQKIETLNLAISQMIDSFASMEDSRAIIHVEVITFGMNVAKVHTPLAPATSIQWTNMAANGATPLGSALTLFTDRLTDKSVVSSKA